MKVCKKLQVQQGPVSIELLVKWLLLCVHRYNDFLNSPWDHHYWNPPPQSHRSNLLRHRRAEESSPPHESNPRPHQGVLFVQTIITPKHNPSANH